MNSGIIGAGSWGSAIAIALSKIMSEVLIYARDEDQVATINSNRLNGSYLPSGIMFGANVVATNQLYDLLVNQEIIFIATPVNALRPILKQLDIHIKQFGLKVPNLIWLCKGFESSTGLLPHQILREVFGEVAFNYGALLGPSFADEVAHSKITGLTIASNNLDFSVSISKTLSKIANFRVYANPDMIGVEICGAVKNIVAIAAGIVDGLSLGDNARAALITRSLSEISKLVFVLGGNYKTVYGLSGVGDLVLTCNGGLSRNRTVGLQIARNNNLEEILRNLGHVAEGVLTTKAVYELCKGLEVDMPIVNAVYSVLYERADIKATIENLLLREVKVEFD